MRAGATCGRCRDDIVVDPSDRLGGIASDASDLQLLCLGTGLADLRLGGWGKSVENDAVFDAAMVDLAKSEQLAGDRCGGGGEGVGLHGSSLILDEPRLLRCKNKECQLEVLCL